MTDFAHIRLIEALLFAAAEPLSEAHLAAHLPPDADLAGVLGELEAIYDGRGVNLVRRGAGWAFRTAPDLAASLAEGGEVARKLSRAAIETLAIIAYHQPVTRAEIEEIRGVSLGKGTLDVLFEAGWVRPKGRRQTPGRPILWATTESFLDHFGLASIGDLPRLEELRASGLLDAQMAPEPATGEPDESTSGAPGDDRDEDSAPDELDEAALERDALERFGSNEG